MGYSYRLCVTTNEDQKAPFPTPDSYNPEDWELCRRTFKSYNKTAIPFIPYAYRGYPGDKKDMCDNGPSTPISTDAANLNKGYSNGTY